MEPEAAVDYLARRKEQDEAWVRCAPARAALHDARRLLIEAASIFYANGISNAGDKYKALADQIRHQGD